MRKSNNRIEKKEILRNCKRIIVCCMAVALAAGAMLGCGKKTESSSPEVLGVQKIKFASGNINDPYCFIDESGELTGFEYDLIKAIDEEVPEIEIEIQDLDWDDMLTSVKAGKIDVAGWQIQKTPEREEEFLFSDDFASTQEFYLVVGKNNDSVHSIEDLQDAVVNGGSPDESMYKFWQDYAAEHPEQNINIISTSNPMDEAGIAALQSGSTTALRLNSIEIAKKNIQLGDELLKRVGDPLVIGHGYYVFRKDDEKTKAAIDKGLKAVKESGKYDEITKKWFGFIEENG